MNEQEPLCPNRKRRLYTMVKPYKYISIADNLDMVYIDGCWNHEGIS